ncbi:MAG: lipocalin family protein [Vampirovibrio sp.]|nr:lipocalin family protein [Vampirovibrio sp.]
MQSGLSQALALTPVESVDPEKYQGKWHEVALIPYFFERKCTQNAFVRYTILDEESDKQPVFEDYFQCETKPGKTKEFLGRAKVVDTDSNAILSATFFKLFGWRYWFGKNYWIIGLDDNYEYAVVGVPSLKYGWVFSRKPALTPDQWESVKTTLGDQGYDLCKFETVPQDGGLQERQSLCE